MPAPCHGLKDFKPKEPEFGLQGCGFHHPKVRKPLACSLRLQSAPARVAKIPKVRFAEELYSQCKQQQNNNDLFHQQQFASRLLQTFQHISSCRLKDLSRQWHRHIDLWAIRTLWQICFLGAQHLAQRIKDLGVKSIREVYATVFNPSMLPRSLHVQAIPTPCLAVVPGPFRHLATCSAASKHALLHWPGELQTSF